MKKTSGRILVIDDDLDIRQAARIILKPYYKEVVTEDNPQKIPFLLNHDSFDVILLDMNFSPGETSGLDALKKPSKHFH